MGDGPRAYYNDINKDALKVIEQLIVDGAVPDGDTDDRSIKDVSSSDLVGYTQCHFFAGGGLWAVASRLAGWPDDRQLWTGSCPCQPHSAAASDRKKGFADPRDLWPDWFRLIEIGKPDVVAGRVALLRIGGNGINPVLAGEFLKAYLDVDKGHPQ